MEQKEKEVFDKLRKVLLHCVGRVGDLDIAYSLHCIEQILMFLTNPHKVVCSEEKLYEIIEEDIHKINRHLDVI